MENKITELESRIEKLENTLGNIELSGDGMSITFNQSPLSTASISGNGVSADFKIVPWDMA